MFNENWLLIKNNIDELVQKFVPSKLSTLKMLPWITPTIKRITPTIKRQMRKRERLYKSARAKKNIKSWKAYNQQRNHAQKIYTEPTKSISAGS